jgi:hypothetical protein
MQALVSIVQDDKDNLRSVVAGKHRFVFVCRGPLVLVAVTKLKLSESQLALQLKYTYNQILSVLTNTQLQQIFDSNPGFDLRYLLQGSEKFIDSILNMMDSDPSFVLAGTRCLAMPVPYRQTISGILSQCRTKDILFIVLVAEGMLVTYATPKEHTLTAMDIHLILNLVHASTSFRSAESWTPICLPKFNDTGFLHAHVSYLPRDSPACLLLISTDKEKFFALQEVQKRIVEVRACTCSKKRCLVTVCSWFTSGALLVHSRFALAMLEFGCAVQVVQCGPPIVAYVHIRNHVHVHVQYASQKSERKYGKGWFTI